MSILPFNRTVIWLTRRQLFAKRRVYVALTRTTTTLHVIRSAA